MALIDKYTDLIGNTPLLKITKLTEGLDADILFKMENFNPLSSVKDRIALSMVEDAEAQGLLKKGSVIIEPTSGNTGIALAYIAAVKGYRIILVMPEAMSIERRKLMKMLGAELVLTPGEKGMKGAVEEATRMNHDIAQSFMPQQFKNPANPRIHYETTAAEIWLDTAGNVDILIAGVGTGGTLTGIARYMKEKKENFQVIAVEPSASPVISGGQAGSHKIQGIGAGFIPEVLEKDIIDEVVTVTHEDAGETARMLARKEGILVGISAGANMKVALDVAARKEHAGKTIVTIACDTGERYLSTWLFDDL